MSRKSDFDKQLEKRIYNLSTRKEKIYSKVGDIDSDKVKSDFGQEALGIMRDIMDNATQSNEDELSEKITRIKQLKTFIKDANLGKREQKELLTLAEKIHKALAKDADLKRKLFIKSAAALGGLLERSKGVASIMFDDELVDDLLEKTSMAGKFMADKVREKIRKHQEKKAIMKQDAQAMLNKSKAAQRPRASNPEAPRRAPATTGISSMFHEAPGYGSSDVSALQLNGSSSILETISHDIKQILDTLKTSSDEKEEARLDALEDKLENYRKDDQDNKKTKQKNDKKERTEQSLLTKILGVLGPMASMIGGALSFAGSKLGLVGLYGAAVYGLGTSLGNEITDFRQKSVEDELARKQAKDIGIDVIENQDAAQARQKALSAGKGENYATGEVIETNKNELKRGLEKRFERIQSEGVSDTDLRKIHEVRKRIASAGMSANYLKESDQQTNQHQTEAAVFRAGINAGREQIELLNKAVIAIEASGDTSQKALDAIKDLKLAIDDTQKTIEKQTEEMKKHEEQGTPLIERILKYFGEQRIDISEIKAGRGRGGRPGLGSPDAKGTRGSLDYVEAGGGETPPDATMRVPYSLNSSSGSAFRNMLSSYGASSSNMTMGPKNPKSGLKIKPAGPKGPNADGFAYPGVYAFAQMLQARVPGNEFKYFSAFNDAWHRRKRSPNNTHVRGLAFDAKFNTHSQLLKGIKLAEQMVRETGAKAIVQQHKDDEGPGYHLHFQFNSPQDAKEFYKKFYGIGGYETPTNQESTIGTDPAAQASTAQNAGREISMGTGTPLNLSTDSIKPIGFGLRSVSGGSGTAPFSAAARSIDPSINRRKPSFRPLLPPDTAPMSPASAYPNLSRLANPSSAAPKSISYSKPGTLFGALVSD